MFTMHCLPCLEENEDMPYYPPNGENGFDDPHRPPPRWWQRGGGWYEVPRLNPSWKPGYNPHDPDYIYRLGESKSLVVEAQLKEPEGLTEGVSTMFGMKLWTILLIAAAIAYFMNK